MKSCLPLVTLLLLMLLCAHAVHAQQLTVINDDGAKVVFDQSAIARLPHVKLTAGSPPGSTFEGIALRSILEKAGIRFGDTLKGKRLASYLLASGADVFRVVIALPELDPSFTDKQVLLAFLQDGKPLAPKEGPFRIVMPDEKRMSRWVKQVTALTIVDAPQQ